MGVLERVRKPAVAAAELPLDRILRDDCVAAMRALPDACVDMVFADPPYNLQLGGDLFRPEGGRVDAVDNDWDKFDSNAVYDAFSHAWLAEARRILKPNGFVVVTTPNAASWFAIYRVLNQEHPSCWPVYSLDESKRRHHIHAREYVVSEVEQLLDAAGFGAITTFTRDYAMRPPYRPIPGVSTPHRGETIFSHGYKAGLPKKRAVPPLYLEDIDFKPRGR